MSHFFLGMTVMRLVEQASVFYEGNFVFHSSLSSHELNAPFRFFFFFHGYEAVNDGSFNWLWRTKSLP